MADVSQWPDAELIAHNAKINSMEWKRNIALQKKTDRHKTINFDNELFNKRKARIKQEMAKRGLK